MRKFTLLLVVMFGTGGLAQERNAADRLGYPPGTRLLLIHADDVGLAHSVDRATFEALDKGFVTSASVMVPCPWLTEVAGFAKSHPNSDLGIHLTLTSEWKTYRWGPVASKNLVSSLLDPLGYFWPDTAPVFSKARPDEVERELTAQVEDALKVGIRPTHVDTHMASVLSPALFPVYVKIARDRGLPFFAIRAPGFPESMTSALRADDIIPDAVAMASPTVKPDGWQQYYESLVRKLKPGLTVLIVHLGHDDAELQAVTVDHPDFGSAWRQRDFDVVGSTGFRNAIREAGIKLVGWKDLSRVAGGR